MKILFIDNKPLSEKELKDIIRFDGYGFTDYFTADNADDALKLVKTENPELILMDICLKDMSGTELIREIKSSDNTGRIIIVSEDTSFENARLALNFGVTAYIGKPIDPAELTEAMLRAIDEIYRQRLISKYYEQSARLSRNNLLTNILLGSMTYVNAMESIYHIALNSDWYRLISFNLTEQEQIDNNKWKEPLSLTKNCLSVTFSNTKLVFIALNCTQKQFILKQMETCKESYPQYASLTGIVSHKAESHTALSKLYEEIERIFQNIYYYKEKQSSIIYSDRLSQRLSTIRETDRNLISFAENITGKILLLQSAELEEDMQLLLDFLALRMPSRDSAGFILLNLYTQILSSIYEYYPHLEFELPDRNELAFHFSYDKYLCDSVSFLSEQFHKAIACIKDASSKNPCQRVRQYIEMNYASPLKLNTIASLFGYNSSYLGKLLMRDMGVNFNTYLDNVRIQKAVEYLKKGVSVIQAGELSGFNNPDYFTQKFKKYMKILPSEYRAKYLECSQPSPSDTAPPVE